MKSNSIIIFTFFFLLYPFSSFSQNIYDINKYTPDDWLNLTTDERMRSLNTANNLSINQSLYGNFNRNFDKYRSWGYDYYDMNDRYENYTFRNFQNYSVLDKKRELWSYNDFGDRFEKMDKKMSIWLDRKYDNGIGRSQNPTGYIDYRDNYFGEFEALQYATESTDNWAVTAVGGSMLRVELTPLTLSKPDLDGMTLDFQSSNYSFRMANSAFFWTLFKPMIRGVQLRRKLGALDIGASFSDSYMNNEVRQKGGSIKGTIEDYYPYKNETDETFYRSVPPSICFVRVMDDSPWDNSGPVVHKVHLRINGEPRDDIVPVIIMDDLKNENITAVNPKDFPHKKSYINNSNYTDFYFSEVENNYPKYADYKLLRDWMSGNNLSGVANHLELDLANKYYKFGDIMDKPIEIDGTRYAVFMFDLSSVKKNVQRIEAEITVANDYRIQISSIQSVTNSDISGTNYVNDYAKKRWLTKAVADGNVKDSSNLRTIRVDFGLEVANMIYGFDMKYEYQGLKIKGEIVRNTHFYMLPEGVPAYYTGQYYSEDITPQKGHRSSVSDKAWYFITEKKWNRFGFGAEFFNMGKFYDPKFRKGLDDTDRGRFLDTSLIADNDDGDKRADSFDQDGVFPGQDLDNDGIPDTDKNLNIIPDYLEPFLMFNSEPNEFSFGDDFNNNAIPDYREDDNKVDTPYDLDKKGRHFYMTYYPHRLIGLTTGSMRSSGIGVANRTDKDYLKLSLGGSFVRMGSLRAEYRYERVRDDIPDYYNLYEYEYTNDGFNNNPYKTLINPVFDHLDYRNSKVNKFYLDMRMKPEPRLTVESFVRYEINDRIPGRMYDGTTQNGENITTTAVMGKAAYTENWKSFIFSAGYKSMLYKKDKSNQYLPEDYYSMLIPNIYMKYSISDKSSFVAGFQGFGSAKYLYKDYANHRNNFSRKDIVVEFQNRSDYYGFIINGSWGFKLTDNRYDDKLRAIENYKSSSFFVDIILGNEYNQ